MDSSTTCMRSIGIVLALLCLPVNADVLIGRVVDVASGDTLTMVDTANRRHKIHLLGIDAPEIQQEFGQASRTSLSAIVFNQHVHATCDLQDALNHAVCVILLRGRDVGLEQLRDGMAWSYPVHDKQLTPQERSVYQQAEFFAKIHRGGLWNSKNPTPPWIFRNGRAE